eukprot:gnl/TRDRNA2_/TRDRNA2_42991_c1_seq1.p1 gnl/TRDRNA2_/TRDRNA2_42991_c1~~gnl/TRDRNA2_/TRDRNA2_42991_c1_seq1.p1  ORF type:complete len:180 (-),score=31.82 gnl/TRDRNA2_/TRDRNA2_42991_c1_seq1:113-652(-)
MRLNNGVIRSFSTEAGEYIKLSDDGFGLSVKESGDGRNFPKRGDKLTMHYIGMLKDGTVFDSSRARNQTFTFTIGRGKVIRAWDQGITSMSLGERCIMHVPSYKGYGDRGAPPAIPPNADLDFDVQLLAINDQAAPGYEYLVAPPVPPTTASPPKVKSAAHRSAALFCSMVAVVAYVLM